MAAPRRELGIACLLVLATWAVYGQTLTFGFVNYDDPVYVTGNLLIQSPLDPFTVVDTFQEIGRSGNWHPLTWLSLMLDYQLFGLSAWGYHLVNVLLHSANVVLLFVVLRLATGSVRRSALVAGFFALHPAHVESVAWVSERKDVLSTCFWMLTTLAYLHYVRRPCWRRYRWVVLAFALGLLAKPMLVTLPATLLLLDYWPLGRCTGAPGRQRAALWQLVVEKLPLFALSAGSAAMTIWAQDRDQALRSLAELSLADRLGDALIGYGAYLRMLVWPTKLAPLYPLAPWRPVELLAPAAAVTVVSILALLWTGAGLDSWWAGSGISARLCPSSGWCRSAHRLMPIATRTSP